MLRIALVIAALLGAACVSVGYTPLNRPPRSMLPKPPDAVEVFVATRPSRPFVEVGLLEGQGRHALVGGTKVLAQLRGRAAELGCDGLLLTGSTSTVVGHIGRHGGSVGTLRGLRATCIVYY